MKSELPQQQKTGGKNKLIPTDSLLKHKLNGKPNTARLQGGIGKSPQTKATSIVAGILLVPLSCSAYPDTVLVVNGMVWCHQKVIPTIQRPILDIIIMQLHQVC